jgi:hypothetical protein
MLLTDYAFWIDLIEAIEGGPDVILEIAYADYLDSRPKIRFVVVDPIAELR